MSHYIYMSDDMRNHPMRNVRFRSRDRDTLRGNRARLRAGRRTEGNPMYSEDHDIPQADDHGDHDGQGPSGSGTPSTGGHDDHGDDDGDEAEHEDQDDDHGEHGEEPEDPEDHEDDD